MPERRARWFWFLPTILLASVALHQLWLARTQNLSPWSGGGFGMFSTTDAGGNRHLHAFARYPGIRRELALPLRLEDTVKRALALPSESRLRALARTLVDPPDPDWGVPVTVAIQVWGTRFDPETLEPEGVLLRTLEVPIGGE